MHTTPDESHIVPGSQLNPDDTTIGTPRTEANGTGGAVELVGEEQPSALDNTEERMKRKLEDSAKIIKARLRFLTRSRKGFDVPADTPDGLSGSKPYKWNKNNKVDGTVLKSKLLNGMNLYSRLALSDPNIPITQRTKTDAYTRVDNRLATIIECRTKIGLPGFKAWREEMMRVWRNYIDLVPFVEKDTRGLLEEFEDSTEEQMI